MLLFLVALLVAGGAGALIAQIRKIVVAGVIVGPRDVYASTGGDVNLNVKRFFALINRDGHGFRIGWVCCFRRSSLRAGWDYRGGKFLGAREKCRCADRAQG
jgi:hypothetical protein